MKWRYMSHSPQGLLCHLELLGQAMHAPAENGAELTCSSSSPVKRVRSHFGSSIVNSTHGCDLAQRPSVSVVMPAMSREMWSETPRKRVAEITLVCDSSPGSSSSSTPPNMLCSKRQCPGLQLPMRGGQADALRETQDEDDRSFLDDIVETEALHEESMDSCEGRPPATPRRLRTKTDAPWFAKRCSPTETVLPLMLPWLSSTRLTRRAMRGRPTAAGRSVLSRSRLSWSCSGFASTAYWRRNPRCGSIEHTGTIAWRTLPKQVLYGGSCS